MITGRRKPKCLEKNLLQCHFDYHKSLEFNWTSAVRSRALNA
jgi:hypothetical protein